MANKNDSSAEGKLDMLKKLRQVRQFSPQPVPRELMTDILEAARWTGSGMNRQPWEFVLITDRTKLKEITQAEGSDSHLARATFAIVVIMPGEGGEINTYDEGRLAERLLLAAAAHGLGAGIWWFKDGGAAAKRILGIPQDRQVRTAVSFGYPSEDAAAPRPGRAQGRKPLSELVHEETY